MKITPTISFLLLICSLCAFAYAESSMVVAPRQKDLHIIAILQTSPHPALDEVSRSFKKKILENSEGSVQFIEQNGMGEMASLQAMAYSLHTQKNIELILTIGTPATQAMIQQEKHKPIIFTALSDPTVLGEGLHQGNVCGLSDRVDATAQVRALQAWMPNLHRLAVVYNPSETNSLAALKALESICKMSDIEVIKAGLQSPSDIPAVIRKASMQSDLIVAPADNLVALYMPMITTVARRYDCPVFAAYCESLKQGARAALGIDYTQMGQEGAYMALQILQKAGAVESLGVQYQTPTWQESQNLSKESTVDDKL